MSALPAFEEVDDRPGEDFAVKWPIYVDDIYRIYCDTIANAGLTFNGLPVRCKFNPMTGGKAFGFWHVMQEGKVEEDRTPDFQRCRRIRWIAWTIRAASISDPRVLVFPQQMRWGEQPWALWLREEKYVVILVERSGYFLLKTAFITRPRKIDELERDAKAYSKS